MNNEKNYKIIFHIDMNMFFCSVAVIKNPSLKGKAFAIGRENSTKGVISTASYEARKYGIHSAMSLKEAFDLKPDLIVVEADFEMIRYYHNKFIGLIKEYSRLVEVASVDECYADMTDISKYRHPLDVAKEIQSRLVKEYKLPCSIGIGPTLFLAKMASDMKKPLGLVVLRKRDKVEKLYPLSVKEIFGVGKKTWPRLIENGINTIKDFEDERNKDKILSLVGKNTYDYVIDAINGKTSAEVMPLRYAKNESISESLTFDNYLCTETDILVEMRKMTKSLVSRINKSSLMTKTVSITLRNKDFKTITRSKTTEYLDDFYNIFDLVCDLLEDNYKENEPIRLVGVGLSNLKDKNEVMKEEYNLFTYKTFVEREKDLKKLISKLQSDFGDDLIQIGLKTESEDSWYEGCNNWWWGSRINDS